MTISVMTAMRCTMSVSTSALVDRMSCLSVSTQSLISMGIGHCLFACYFGIAKSSAEGVARRNTHFRTLSYCDAIGDVFNEAK